MPYAVTHLRWGGWVRSINSVVFNPTCMQQTFGKFQIIADTRLFNIDVLRASVPLLVLLDSPSPNRLISLTLPSPIHGTDGFILHITRNNKCIHEFEAKIKSTDVWRRTDKISSQNLWILWHCFRLLPPADSLSLKHLGNNVPPKRSMPLSIKLSLNGQLH